MVQGMTEKGEWKGERGREHMYTGVAASNIHTPKGNTLAPSKSTAQHDWWYAKEMPVFLYMSYRKAFQCWNQCGILEIMHPGCGS
jgi:hypothetical protein